HKTGGKAGAYDAPRYLDEMIRHTDYRRFDDILRLVLDCSESQITDLRTRLEDMSDKGRITYGMHISKTALMTCLVFNLEESEHVHFLDGGDGGFAIAAKHLKRNISKLQRRDDGKNSV
ncbi:MAG: DUF3095 family protein, partial [Alphaproteobacteria bacterium]|nr:DUF3095 family protein [Alphaproteobacteria bacterium]